ncbi:hypothetical protein AgCh_000103 [Apium graveolens]
MASGVVLRRRKVISYYLNNISVSARFYFGHAKSAHSLLSTTFTTSTRNSNILLNSAFGLSTPGCHVNWKSQSCFISAPRTTTSRFMTSQSLIDEDHEMKSWAYRCFSWKTDALAKLYHFQLGIQLLCANVSITLRLLVKVFRGEILSRRERQLLTRTTSYFFRDVPGALMFGIPLIKFLLPVFLKLFPNMLRSTFQDKPSEQERKRKLKAGIEFAKFLQDTVKEMDQVVEVYWNKGPKVTAEGFFKYKRRLLSGKHVSEENILCFAALISNRFTLDNISRCRLVDMCKYMGITAYGTDEYMRFMLLERLKSIEGDDKLIQKKGLELLSEAEVCKYCRERGIYAGEEMRQQLCDWLDLSVNNSVPSSLLILSRAFTVNGKKPVEVLLDTLRSLPLDLIQTVGTISLPSNNPLHDKRNKIDLLNLQKKHIKLCDWLDLSVNNFVPSSLHIFSRAFTAIGKKPVKVLLDTLRSLPLDLIHTVGAISGTLSIAFFRLCYSQRKVKREKINSKEDKKLQAMQSNSHTTQDDVLKGVTNGASGQARARAVDENVQLCELSNAMAVLDSALNVYTECEKILSLVNDEKSMGAYSEDECKEGAIDPWGNDVDAILDNGDNVTSVLTDKVDAMVKKIGKKINVDEKIERYCDGKIDMEVVAAVASYLKVSLDKEGIKELISNHSKYKEEIVKLGNKAEDVRADAILQ